MNLPCTCALNPGRRKFRRTGNNLGPVCNEQVVRVCNHHFTPFSLLSSFEQCYCCCCCDPIEVRCRKVGDFERMANVSHQWWEDFPRWTCICIQLASAARMLDNHNSSRTKLICLNVNIHAQFQQRMGSEAEQIFRICCSIN